MRKMQRGFAFLRRGIVARCARDASEMRARRDCKRCAEHMQEGEMQMRARNCRRTAQRNRIRICFCLLVTPC
eukprot:4787743-Pleurochrysis_carterae.AAC.2